MWKEMHLGRVASAAETVSALSEALGIAPDAILIVDDWPALPGPPAANVRLVVERYLYGGEYPLRLSCNVLGLPAMDALAVVRQVCAALRTACLVDDGTPDPYTWLRVSADGAAARVSLDVDALERQEMVVARVLGAFGDAPAAP